MKWARNCTKRAESIQAEGFAVAVVPGKDPCNSMFLQLIL
jgi:hypothetical protein